MMPPAVAAMIKAGHTVAPKIYTSATILFADIVGFTALCAQSSPVQVVTMLNVLYLNVDTIVTEHDAYKVGIAHLNS